MELFCPTDPVVGGTLGDDGVMDAVLSKAKPDQATAGMMVRNAGVVTIQVVAWGVEGEFSGEKVAHAESTDWFLPGARRTA